MGRVGKAKFKVNLKELFGTTVPDDESLRQEIADAVVRVVQERTAEGVSAKGNKFKAYSKKYAEKKGVGVGDVDLRLFGDMLESLDMIESTPQTITLGFDDELQNAKAWNHNTGDTLPKREFLGLMKKEMQVIAEQFAEQVQSLKDQSKEADTITKDELQQIVTDILSGQFDDELGI